MIETMDSDETTGDRPLSRATLAGVSAFITGFLIYVAVAGLGGGVSWEDRLTFDQSGELELEGVGIFFGIILGATVGAPLGTYIALRWTRAAAAGTTAAGAAFATGLVTALALWVVPTGPQDPILAPYAVFGGWFLAPFLTRRIVIHRVHRDTDLSF
jgi:cytochrome c biogenesis protein CcdA